MASDVERYNGSSIEVHKKPGFIEYGSNEVEVLLRKHISSKFIKDLVDKRNRATVS